MRRQEIRILVDGGIGLNVDLFEADPPPSERRDLIVLHGWPNAGRIWTTFASAMLLADPRFRIIAPTFRGYGLSDRPTDGYTCERFALDVRAVLDSLGVDEFALVGHSMGGKIAQMVALRAGEGLTSLVLIAPAPATAGNVPLAKRQEQQALFGDTTRIAALIDGMAAAPLKPSVRDVLIEDGMLASEHAFTRWIDPMREEDFSTELPLIAVPTLVLFGTADPLRTEEGLRTAVVNPIPGASLVPMPNTGHLGHVEDPMALALLVVNFLDRSQPAGAA
ncbi:MAG: alpha/beta hydrolase [Capsulimonadales bacterium]|nr:alpha/beta hydrolase [Capsulimonadales bacterium]